MTDSSNVPADPSGDGELDTRRKRILFRTLHRGMKEMDMLLGGFTKAEIAHLSDAELDELEEIIPINDQDLYAWITGRKPLPEEWDRPLFRKMLAFHDITLG